MPDANDNVLLVVAPSLAKAQIVEVRIKQATDGEYELGLGDLDPLLFVASGDTVTAIRDGLADPIVSPAYDPYVAAKLITDRFRVRGAKGDPFDFYLTAPGGTADAVATQVQAASGAPTETRLMYLELVKTMILGEVWGPKQQMGQALLAAYFLEAWILGNAAISGVAAGGNATAMSLGGASLTLGGAGAMPSAAALATSTAFGQPFLLLASSVGVTPVWS
jgi:hypothetical protein